MENLLVCLNLENPKADVPLLVKNPFLKREAWGFVICYYNWPLATTQIADGEKITCNLWRAIMFFLAIFDAVRISEALVQRKLHDRVRVLENWLLWPKWKLWCYSQHCQCVGAPDIRNNHIWGFWGAYDVAWASFFPWILFNLWFPVVSILSTLFEWPTDTGNSAVSIT